MVMVRYVCFWPVAPIASRQLSDQIEWLSLQRALGRSVPIEEVDRAAIGEGTLLRRRLLIEVSRPIELALQDAKR